MKKIRRKKVLRAAKSSRYHSFLSIGELLGVTSPALKDVTKVEFLPQWEEYGQTDAVLSKRSLLVDIGMSDIQLDDVLSTIDLLDNLRSAVSEKPDELLRIIQAFGRSGSKPEREKALERAERLNLFRTNDPSQPTAIWGVVLLAGAAVLISGCCQWTDTECDSDTDTDGGSTGGGSTDG